MSNNHMEVNYFVMGFVVVIGLMIITIESTVIAALIDPKTRPKPKAGSREYIL